MAADAVGGGGGLRTEMGIGRWRCFGEQVFLRMHREEVFGPALWLSKMSEWDLAFEGCCRNKVVPLHAAETLHRKGALHRIGVVEG